MSMNRRRLIQNAFAGGAAAALTGLPGGLHAQFLNAPRHGLPGTLQDRYAKLDAELKRPVFRRELFKDPVIIETVELLNYKDSWIGRVRAKGGAEGICISNSLQIDSVYPVMTRRLAPFFIGKDARDLDDLLEQAYVYDSNYKMQSLALWVPLATIEFAILDMFGKMANLPMGLLISDKIYNKEVFVYQANGERDNSAEEVIEHLQRDLALSKAKAIKFKLGGRMSHEETPAGRSEKLIPLVRKTFGDKMILSADANGSYDVKEAIKIGKIMQEYKYAFYEEPVPFDWYEETKQVADALEIPIAGGEQEASMHNFRWLVANGALSITQQDMFYYGGMVRSMRVARMAHALGKQTIPHISAQGLGYLYMMHFVSAIPNSGPYHEFKEFNNTLQFKCPTSTMHPDDRGAVKVPTGPGLGIEVDPAYIALHKVVKG